MRKLFVGIAALLLAQLCLAADSTPAPADSKAASDAKPEHFEQKRQQTKGRVTVGGQSIDYDAYAGNFIVHPIGWDDVPQNTNKDDKPQTAEASMFYVAYLRSGGRETHRPVTFVFNGGPGSSTVWLHMGAFGPKRVVTANDSHTPAAPYSLVNNDACLLDATDLVFIDAPGTGFSRVAGKDRDKAFYGVDQDANAFADFISQFLSEYGRWNSPKYLFGESYGTTRAATLVNLLQTDRHVDFNGVIMLSQILAFDTSPDGPQFNPGVDLPYELALPTYAASAWYHHKLRNAPADLPTLLAQVEQFALTDYAVALNAGSELTAERRHAIAEKLSQYTSLPIGYLETANLRVNGGEFQKTLLDPEGLTSGRLDMRFSGPSMDRLSQEAQYDPQFAAIGSAYVSAYNEYARKELKAGAANFKPIIDLGAAWNWLHQPPGVSSPLSQSTNVMPDLAVAMKSNPRLRVLLNAGYYDLATPYFEGVFEMRHLPIPAELQSNIEFKFYESGHMVYAEDASRRALHDNVVDFIRRTNNAEAVHVK